MKVGRAKDVMRCFRPEEIPVLATLAREFAVCDAWFSSVPGPTLPNRAFAHCGTSNGSVDMNPLAYMRQADHLRASVRARRLVEGLRL